MCRSGSLGIVLATRFIANVRVEHRTLSILSALFCPVLPSPGWPSAFRPWGSIFCRPALSRRCSVAAHSRRWPMSSTPGARRRRSSICRCSSCRHSAPAFIGGFLFRLGIGALPFLLPLLLQIGFDLTPFQSGLITFTTALGSMFMKAAVVKRAQPLRLPQRAALQRARQQRFSRRLRHFRARHALLRR